MASTYKYKILSMVLISMLIVNCNHHKSMIEIIGVKGSTLPIESLKDLDNKVIRGEKIAVIFVNNPAKFRKNDKAILYLNGDLIYYGNFSESFIASIPVDIKEREIVHFVLKIARIDQDKKQVTYYDFQNKSICLWNKNFNYLYIGFFPTNDETNRVVFFPQETKDTTSNIILQMRNIDD